MPKITSIKQQANKKRVNVYLDEKFGFGIDIDNFVLLKLRVGNELSEVDIKDIIKKAEFQKTLDKLLRFATVRPRSEREIVEYFDKKKVHETLREGLIEKLKYFELLDDLKFSKWWVTQRKEFRPKPIRVLIQELRQKGIDTNIIELVFSEESIDEEKIASDLINKKIYKWEKYDKKIASQKKAQYLLSKGFSWEIIKKIVGSKDNED